MIIPVTMPLPLTILVFILTAVVIGFFGIKMTYVARTLASETNIGEAMMGALFISASTSLSGITLSLTAAATGHASLAVSNSLGGIAAQTAFLAIADIVYRRANLEHAAASAENLMMTAFLITLLAIHAVALAIPQLTLFAIHPASFLLLGAYIVGIYLLNRTRKMPMWFPRQTLETHADSVPTAPVKQQSVPRLWGRFAFYAVIVASSGWVLANTGLFITTQTSLSEGLVGGIFTALSTSLPELVIAITAVRLRALSLAVGDIIGGNAFDTLTIALSDIAFREGSIYAAISRIESLWLALTLLMSSILLIGLLHREKYGIANIGMESFLMLLTYSGGLLLITYVL